MLALLLWGAVEAICAGGLVALERWKGLVYAPQAMRSLTPRQAAIVAVTASGEVGYVTLDAELGWTLLPSSEREGPGYRANAQGIRADREFASMPPPGVVRVAAFGDSFTHGSDVPNGFTWADRMSAADPRLEVLNFGVPGYGTDQAFLRFRRRAAEHSPHVALLGVMSDNPQRNLNTFRPFYEHRSGLPLGKPRFVVGAGGELELIPNPLPRPEDYQALLERTEEVLTRVGAHDSFFRAHHARAPLEALPSSRFLHVVTHARFHRPYVSEGVYDPQEEAFQVARGILRAFHSEALDAGMLPVIVFLPQGRDIRAVRYGGRAIYASLVAECEATGLLCLDAVEAFAPVPDEGLPRLLRGHYTEPGNEVVARYLAERFAAEGWVTPEGVAAARARLGGGPQ